MSRTPIRHNPIGGSYRAPTAPSSSASVIAKVTPPRASTTNITSTPPAKTLAQVVPSKIAASGNTTSGNTTSGNTTSGNTTPGNVTSAPAKTPAKVESKSKSTIEPNMVLLDDLYKKENHWRIWSWPNIEMKALGIDYKFKVEDRRYIFRKAKPSLSAIPTPSTHIDLELLVIRRVNRERKFDYDVDMELEHKFTMPLTVFEKVKRLISKEYAQEMEKKKQENYMADKKKWLTTYILDLKVVESKSLESKSLEPKSLDSESKDVKGSKDSKDSKTENHDSIIKTNVVEFIISITRDFCAELFEDVSFLNVELLANSAREDFVESFYWFFVNLVNPSTIVKEQQQKEILRRRMFYDHYPAFYKFASEVAEVCEGDYPCEYELKNSLIESVNIKYNSKIVDFVKKIIGKS